MSTAEIDSRRDSTESNSSLYSRRNSTLIEDTAFKKIRVAYTEIEKRVPFVSGTITCADRKIIREAADELRDYNVQLIAIIKELRNRVSVNETEQRENITVPTEKSRVPTYSAAVKSTVDLVIQPDNKDQAADITVKKIRATVNPVKDQIAISGMRPGKNGAVVVKCVGLQDAEKFKKFLKPGAGLTAKEVEKVAPRMVLVGVEKGRQEDEIIETIAYQNTWPDLTKQAAVFDYLTEKFRYGGSRGDQKTENVVFEVNPIFRKQLLGKPINFEFCRVYFRDFISVTQCYNCYSYGHKSKDCNEKEQLCGHCGGTHHIRTCKKEHLGCAACKKHNQSLRNENLRVPENHHAKDSLCPTKRRFLNRAADRINYNED